MTSTASRVRPCVRSTPSPPRPKVVTSSPVRPRGRFGSAAFIGVSLSFGTAGLDPRLVEGGVLHALAVLDEVAVDGVDRAVCGLGHGRVMVGAFRLVLEVADDGPR